MFRQRGMFYFSIRLLEMFRQRGMFCFSIRLLEMFRQRGMLCFSFLRFFYEIIRNVPSAWNVLFFY